jgi:hypothetical protein
VVAVALAVVAAAFGKVFPEWLVEVAWQHHTSMVILAMLFMTRERMLHFRGIELLSFPYLVIN